MSTSTVTGARPMTCVEYVPGPEFALRAAPSFGNESLFITVGTARVAMEGLSASQSATLAARYGVFARQSGESAARRATVRLFEARRPGFLQVGVTEDGIERYRIVTSWQGSLLMATSYEWSGWVNLASGEAGLALADVALADTWAFDRSIENYLRVLFAHLLVREGGFLLHSAGLVQDGRAYLFFGPSGSGKTTVCTLSPQALVLSDDLALITKGGGGEPRATSVPFRGRFAPEYTTVESFPVAGFFRLVQSPEDRLEEVTGARSVGELVGSLPFVAEQTDMLGEVMDTVSAACRRAPVFRLHFTKSRNFWNTLSAAGLSRPVDSFSDERGMKA